MSFFLLREILVIYIFLFYAYFYFAIDEEFVVFIILAFWVIFLIVFYLKTISSIFYDSMESLSSEFFFFHDKKNMILSVFRDQYLDFIYLHKVLYNLFNIFKSTINSSINNKVVNFYNTSNLYLSDSVNFFKSYFKMSVIFFYISSFAYFHNIINLFIKELNALISLFYNKFNLLRIKHEGNKLKSLYGNHFSENSVNDLLPYLVGGNKKSYEFNSNIVYNKLNKNSDNKFIFNQIDSLKKPSVLRIVHRLNMKVYYKNLFLYPVLREYSFINLA
jgi:hypothetical protein